MEIDILDRLTWAGAGLIVALIIIRRFKPEPLELEQNRFYGAPPARFHAERSGMFNVKVVALEFDEAGPVMFVNGEYKILDEPVEIDMVTVEMTLNGSDETFVSFEPCGEENPIDRRFGSLINLNAPITLPAYDRGLFRTPLFLPDRAENLNATMAKLKTGARNMVEKYDTMPESHFADERSMANLETDYLSDRNIQKLTEEIKQHFIWSPGSFALSLSFLDSQNQSVEKITLSITLSHEQIETLRTNVERVVINSLYAELELPHELYKSVVCER